MSHLKCYGFQASTQGRGLQRTFSLYQSVFPSPNKTDSHDIAGCLQYQHAGDTDFYSSTSMKQGPRLTSLYTYTLHGLLSWPVFAHTPQYHILKRGSSKYLFYSFWFDLIGGSNPRCPALKMNMLSITPLRRLLWWEELDTDICASNAWQVFSSF
jgi:hypothetical protein